MTETVTESATEQTQQETIDFKMVTFSLGGKDYGIDIMRVKEIAKFTQFTYVPNTAHYVRGVYNLRGDIISIVDLRAFFNIPAEQKEEDEPENGLILRLESNLLGVIVDSIDKVVGISSKRVQPPHPIFGDINIKYISGVADYDGRLYIILDVDRIFRRKEDVPADEKETLTRKLAENAHVSVAVTEDPDLRESPGAKELSSDDTEVSFLADGVAAFTGFQVSPVNHTWFVRRAQDWISRKKSEGSEYQLKEDSAAEEFLSPFYSRYTGAFWKDTYAEGFAAHIPDSDSTVYNVWNPGCGNGHESYSLAVLLKKRYPNRQIKIWAGDKDLLQISTAPNLVFHPDEIPPEWEDLTVKGKNGLTFRSDIKEMILFEFSDVLSVSSMPKMDIIVARDLLSFQNKEDQERILERFDEVLKPGGVLVLGDNEDVGDGRVWESLDAGPVNMFNHR
jgi:purine-binding chemotaxis protein CheW